MNPEHTQQAIQGLQDHGYDPADIAARLDRAAAFQDDQWTNHCMAEDENCRPVNPKSQEATAWCAVIHLDRAIPDNPKFLDTYRLLNSLLPREAEMPPDVPAHKGPQLNRWAEAPERTPAEVRQLFQQGAAVLRAAGA